MRLRAAVGFSISLWLGLGLVGVLPGRAGAALKSDETVILFPAIGWPSRDGWSVEARGIIFETDEASGRAAVFGRVLGIDVDGLTADERRIFQRRVSPFLADHERGKRLELEVGGARLRTGKSAPNGHFETRFSLSVERVRTGQTSGPVLMPVKISTSPGANREMDLAIHFLSTNGWSVISDLDDTIKVSQVSDKRALIRGTFCQPFQAVAGMAAAFRHWAESGAQFHYLSASPWQLYPALSEFIVTNRFPAGTFHLKLFRYKDSSALRLLGTQNRYKTEAMTTLMGKLPGRQFVLVGDSGEQDPEIYGDMARRYGSRVVHIFIRDTTGDGRESARYRRSFRDLEGGRWTIFGTNGAAILTNTPGIPGWISGVASP